MNVTDDMVERGGRALCAFQNEKDRKAVERGEIPKFIPLRYEDWRDEYDAEARAVIVAALDDTQSGGEQGP